jgi:pyruvate ferredoxin oxidoreductase alpha subunit
MSRSLITGNRAAAWAARLARVDYVPAFPITPQTEIIETLAQWSMTAELGGCRMVTLDSEHSMLTAAGSAATTGVRVFTATSSQGLLYAMEMIYAVSGWRAPFVMVNVSRGLASPVTLEPDHNDVLAARDSGFLQLHCGSCQEVLDSVLIAYRVAEDSKVRLPVLVNLDGFYLSFTREPVAIPKQADVDRFLPPFDPQSLRFRADRPLSHAVAVLGGAAYSYFRYQTHLAARAALEVYDQAAGAFSRRFGRKYEAIDAYRADDAEIVFVMIGSFATKAKAAVDQLREAGKAVGLIRPRLLRPFPTEALRQHLRGKRGVAVIDQNISLGQGGVLFTELTSALYGVAAAPPAILSYIGGLGGRDITAEEFYRMAEEVELAESSGSPPPPRLLYTEDELEQMRRLQKVGQRERKDGAEQGCPRGTPDR